MNDLPPTPSPARGFVHRPEPKAIGNVDRGSQILGGELQLAGHVLKGDPFATPGLPVNVASELHGFGWLDDLAALASHPARAVVQRRVLDWIADHPEAAPGAVEWAPEVAGKRVLRWIFHSGMVLPGLDRNGSEPFFESLEKHVNFLAEHWHTSPDGKPRLETLAGLAVATIYLRGAEHLVMPALIALGEEAEAMGAETLMQPRSPESLLDACTLLVWTVEAASEAGIEAPPQLLASVGEMAPSLRALRHADGALPQFHGGGRGVPGRLDHCLRAAPGPAVSARGQAMGFARMVRGRTTVILDAAAPPTGVAAATGHASTLAFEMTVARQPLIVSCGPGMGFGPIWARASRATPCHSTLCLAGLSSSRLGPAAGDPGAAPDVLTQRPENVWAGDYDGQGRLIGPDFGLPHSGTVAHMLAGHDGWMASHGLSHLRELWLDPDGFVLDGEDSIAALDEVAQARLAEIVSDAGRAGIGFDLRFHLHAEVTPEVEGDFVHLRLAHGDDWYFSHDGTAELRIEPSCWLDPAQAGPVPTRQIVLTAVLTGQAMQIGWTLARAEGR
ncbi:heparinase II/III family protein [Paracoccus aminophilus]|uniref:Heparinase II/III family protein n=1 Tax=Paracoccus aminophilus JCM 7686 TaxID=1367847 RepID=S5YYM4_PARAH|nr:heparinase II/III family protein [Paracoccus aminophilus]AGT10311.1 heparinase II/III family protein [Paracoccus aminophilus JCM 7686]